MVCLCEGHSLREQRFVLGGALLQRCGWRQFCHCRGVGKDLEKPCSQIPAFLAFLASTGKDLGTILVGEDSYPLDHRPLWKSLKPLHRLPRTCTKFYNLGVGDHGAPQSMKLSWFTPIFQPK